MADGELKLELGEDLSARLRAAADSAGRPAEAYAAELIAEVWTKIGLKPTRRYAEYQQTGEYLDAGAEMERFRRAVAERVGSKRP